MSYSVAPWTVALPGSSIHGIFQARILEWVAISFSTEMGIFVHIFWMGGTEGRGADGYGP